MKIKIAINGFGRIGRLLFRELWKNKNFEVVAINDLGDVENLAYLLKYDTVYRKFDEEVRAGNGELIVGGKKIKVLQEKDPTLLPWKKMDVDVAIESTGAFESFEKAEMHLKAGAKRVVITAPAKDGERVDAKTVLMGVNEKEFKVCKITSNGSCTTNAVSPVAAIMAETIGVKKAVLSTVHAYTATQSIVDSPTKGKDFRRGRAGGQNISPSTTGAAVAVTRAFPELQGKFDGVAIRVPVIVGSLVDFTFVSDKKTSVEEVNEIFRKAAKEKRWQGIMSVSEDQIVSSDIIGDPHGAII
ncbi:MAG: type I glyceraldehyde-3-phosphate dehydrogenase, partial [Minisyncoccota bacterium]